jgi:ribonucleotide monophosphatase NagD (HAD superfamily)
MSHLRRFAGFWWSFIVGDDLPLAIGVGAAIGLTAVLVASGLDAWWLLPVAVVGFLAASLLRELKTARGR